MRLERHTGNHFCEVMPNFNEERQQVTSMSLKSMQDFVEKISEAISNILGLDVVIVDSNYERIGNTFAYDSAPFPISKMSIVGQIMETGKPIGIHEKTEYHICKNCPNIENCTMSCVIGVPIFFRKKVVGAIALIIPAWKQEEQQDIMRNAVGFLEKMADLLSSKIQNTVDYEEINRIRKERECLMDSLDDAIAATDASGRLTYCNAVFRKLFSRHGEGTPITECVNHPVIREALVEHSNLSDRPIYCQMEDQDFFGLVNCQNLKWDGALHGMLFTFHSLRQLNRALDRVSDSTVKTTFASLTCQRDESMRHLTGEAKSLAVTDKILLIEGARGTGKTQLAKAIHNFSNRSDYPFVMVNCHDLSVQDREEEIFGTLSDGSVMNLGKLWQAHRGTIYFKGVDALPLFLQERLVEFVKHGSLRKVDGRDVLVNDRIIFSSAEDLARLAQEGRFSEALYYRMKESRLLLPPLSQRPEDIAYLFRRYVRFYSAGGGKPVPQISPEVTEVLRGYSWPGNIPELQRAAEHAVLRAVGNVITPECVDPGEAPGANHPERSMDDMERQHIAHLLAAHKNKNEVAEILNISRATLYRKIKKYHLTD